MTIQYEEGPVRFGAADWQRTYGGLTFGVKLRSDPFAAYSMLCVRQDGQWSVVAVLNDDLTDEKITAQGGVAACLTRAVQLVQVWLATRFDVAPTLILDPLPVDTGPLVEQLDRALFACVRLSTPEISWANVRRIAVLGDSISSRNNGAASTSWPEQLESMIRSLGVFDIEVRNYSIPGMRWRQAFVPTPNRMIRGTTTPLDAIKRDGCDLLLVYLGANDRGLPDADQDAADFAVAAAELPYVVMRQSLYDAVDNNDCIVTEFEQAAMDRTYAQFGARLIRVGGLNVLYNLGYSFDKAHPTDTGKQWIAANVYTFLQQHMALTPIARNGAWLNAQPPEVQAQYRMANS